MLSLDVLTLGITLAIVSRWQLMMAAAAAMGLLSWCLI
jgi:hypothetical protein